MNENIKIIKDKSEIIPNTPYIYMIVTDEFDNFPEEIKNKMMNDHYNMQIENLVKSIGITHVNQYVRPYTGNDNPFGTRLEFYNGAEHMPSIVKDDLIILYHDRQRVNLELNAMALEHLPLLNRKEFQYSKLNTTIE